MSLDYRHIILLVIFVGGLSATLLAPPFAQAPDYHQFADARALWGIPLAADVLSNIAFMLAGLAELLRLKQLRMTPSQPLPDTLRLWMALYCFSLIATGFGSVYYHAAPDNLRLFWDRLPMTITFSLFFCLVLASHIALTVAKKSLLPMLLLGTLATLHWRFTELKGQGDLRFYVAFQFLPLVLAVLMLALFKSRWLQKRWLVGTVFAYLVAKMFELNDATIYELTGIVSGHTLKHLAAALGAWWVIRSSLNITAVPPGAPLRRLPSWRRDAPRSTHHRSG